MRIAINGILLSRCVSGVETAIANLARALAQGGREEYLLYLPHNAPLEELASPHFQTRRCHLPGRARPLRMAWEQFVLPRLLRRDRVDLLHAPGYLAPLRAGVPVVITVYDLIALLFPRLCTLSNTLNYRCQLPGSIRRAAGIIVPSETTRRDLVTLFPAAADKVRVIPLGIGREFTAGADPARGEELRGRYALPDRFILFVGQLEPKKNIAGLVRGFAALRAGGHRQHRLVIAGSHGWGCAEFERAVRQFGLEQEVIFPGFIPAVELPALYRLADLFVFPSLYEGFGLPPLEAMACGVPAVVSNRGSLPEIVSDAALQVEPLDADALARAMRNLLTQDELRRTQVQKGLARARMFTWERTARMTEEFCQRVFAEALRGQRR